MNAEIKKNIFMQNVAPGTHELSTKTLKREPSYSMGVRIEDIDKRIIVSPSKYSLPSKVVETNGRSFGLKPKIADTSNVFSPGPGQYS